MAISQFSLSQSTKIDEIKKVQFELENPISTHYLKTHLKTTSPRIILTPELEKNLRSKLESDPVLINYYQYIIEQANEILNKQLLERELEGFRLLRVSRQMLERMGILSMAYRLNKSPIILAKINAEIKAVCNFEDWNPQHFLDVGEMSMAVALTIDWVGEWLPKETVRLAKESLIEKGINESFNEDNKRMFWVSGNNNWNTVCHGGMIAASLVIADIDPELASRTISRALDNLPGSLHAYYPHGIYPEGPTYWGYGTAYAIMIIDAFRTSLGTDFGITKSPGFMESPNFVLQATAPSGNYFNFADCGKKNTGMLSIIMSWFASETGNTLFYDEKTLSNPSDMGRFAGLGLIWLSRFEAKIDEKLSNTWFGKGPNPIAVFRDRESDFYLASKGGAANLSHGNMDAGSFVFELDSVRWSIDPGNQSYYPLNRIGYSLSTHRQESPRWKLLTKNNFGHSTLTINDSLYNYKGYAPLINYTDGDEPEVEYDMSDIFTGQVLSANRKFIKLSKSSCRIEDDLVFNDNTKKLTWGMMTVAEVYPTNGGAILKENGKELKLTILEPKGLQVSVVNLDPPPMEVDKSIKNLKRIEIVVPAYIFEGNVGKIIVRLSKE
tara:strand:- start:15081 stop:16910 length:1830 start_codon:yes stop_codon:yes gene_type:complete